jgi:glycine cleavage system H protein
VNLEDFLFSETHEWVRVQNAAGGKFATIGINAFAVEQLTDLVYMELPEVGRALQAGDEFGVVESVKAVSPLYSPVSGEVVAVNAQLPDQLETLSKDPYEAGWIIRVKLTDEGSLSKLLDRQAYERQCAAEG